MIEQFANDVESTLASAIDESQTTLTVDDDTGFPGVPYRIRIDDELLLVTGKSGTGDVDWTVERGIENSSAVAHDDGVEVVHVLTAGAVNDSVRKVVQVVTAKSDVNDSTTSNSFQSSSLSASITPLFDDSLLIVQVHGSCDARRVSGTTLNRVGEVGIWNTTDAAMLVSALFGQVLTSTDSLPANSFNMLTLQGHYIVDNTVQYTFELHFRSLDATDVEARIRGEFDGPILMTIWEVRP